MLGGTSISPRKMSRMEQSVMASSEPHREALIASLRQRYANAVRDDSADAKQALFKEAVYLGIQPELFTEPDGD